MSFTDVELDLENIEKGTLYVYDSIVRKVVTDDASLSIWEEFLIKSGTRDVPVEEFFTILGQCVFNQEMHNAIKTGMEIMKAENERMDTTR